MVFALKTCLYVSSIPKPQTYEKKFFNFSKWGIFSNSLLFPGKTAFLQISADFVTAFEKFLFHLKDLQKKLFCGLNSFGGMGEKQLDVFFVTHCTHFNPYAINFALVFALFYFCLFGPWISTHYSTNDIYFYPQISHIRHQMITHDSNQVMTPS